MSSMHSDHHPEQIADPTLWPTLWAAVALLALFGFVMWFNMG